MKQLYLFTLCLFFSRTIQAERRPVLAKAAKNISKEGAVRFTFHNLASADAHKDSVLIIFDRYNHTGAGVIYQVYSVDNEKNISIDKVPAGKYYVTIQGLGLHRDRMETIVRIKAKKSEKLAVTLEDSEEFNKDKVVIPAYKPNFANLAVLRMK